MSWPYAWRSRPKQLYQLQLEAVVTAANQQEQRFWVVCLSLQADYQLLLPQHNHCSGSVSYRGWDLERLCLLGRRVLSCNNSLGLGGKGRKEGALVLLILRMISSSLSLGREKRKHSPFEMVIYTKHCLVFLPRILNVNTAGETQLMLCKAQLLQSLLGRNQTEALQRKGTNPLQAISLCFLKLYSSSVVSCRKVCVHHHRTPAGKIIPFQSKTSQHISVTTASTSSNSKAWTNHGPQRQR